MATGWKPSTVGDTAWRAPKGITSAERATEQDRAAGGRDRRIIAINPNRSALASICLRLPARSRRVYAYLRWAEGHKTKEKYVGQVNGTTRAENLTQAWNTVAATGLIAATPAAGWASTPEVRNVMRANRSRDTGPEIALRSAVHALGLRYRVDKRPIPGLRRTADLVFAGPKVAVFLDGCFWHGCPEHHRPANRNSEFWTTKIDANQARDLDTNTALTAAGWTVIRVWEHEPPNEAARRIETAVLALHRSPTQRQRGASPATL
jgi:DNA mismatch endonuclease Vsr